MAVYVTVTIIYASIFQQENIPIISTRKQRNLVRSYLRRRPVYFEKEEKNPFETL